VLGAASDRTEKGGGISRKKTKRGKGTRGARVREHDAHVLVCGGGACKKRGARDVRRALKGELRAEDMIGDVRVDSVGCLGLCKYGPNFVVYPGGTWYLGLVEEDIPEVVRRHLKSGEPVGELAAEFRPRKKAKR
jgi:(2Fe-2S) ferredoxin